MRYALMMWNSIRFWRSTSLIAVVLLVAFMVLHSSSVTARIEGTPVFVCTVTYLFGLYEMTNWYYIDENGRVIDIVRDETTEFILH